jgi:hypothetical protein
MVFGDSWDSCWDKVIGFDKTEKIWAMTAVMAVQMIELGTKKKHIPEIRIVDGYS